MSTKVNHPSRWPLLTSRLQSSNGKRTAIQLCACILAGLILTRLPTLLHSYQSQTIAFSSHLLKEPSLSSHLSTESLTDLNTEAYVNSTTGISQIPSPTSSSISTVSNNESLPTFQTVTTTPSGKLGSTVGEDADADAEADDDERRRRKQHDHHQSPPPPLSPQDPQDPQDPQGPQDPQEDITAATTSLPEDQPHDPPGVLSERERESGRTGKKELLVLGYCEGFRVFLGMQREDRDAHQSQRLLLQHAFPEKEVVFNMLNSDCSRRNDTLYNHTDVVFFQGLDIHEDFKSPITSVRKRAREENWPIKAHYNTDLVYFRESHMVPLHKFRNRTFTMGINGEWFTGYNQEYDLIIDTQMNNFIEGMGVYFPSASQWFLPGMGVDYWKRFTVNDLVLPKDFSPERVLETKTGFCAFMASACDNQWYQDASGTIRVALFDALASQYKQPTALGRCRNPVPDAESTRLRSADRDREDFLDAAVELYRPYKFVITFENHIGEHVDRGYWTEKLQTAILANAIPIYGGTSKDPPFVLSAFVNQDRFIYCQFDRDLIPKMPFNDKDVEFRVRMTRFTQQRQLKECVDKIRRVDEDDELFKRIIATPYLLNNQVEGSIFDIRRIAYNIRVAICSIESYLCP